MLPARASSVANSARASSSAADFAGRAVIASCRSRIRRSLSAASAASAIAASARAFAHPRNGRAGCPPTSRSTDELPPPSAGARAASHSERLGMLAAALAVSEAFAPRPPLAAAVATPFPTPPAPSSCRRRHCCALKSAAASPPPDASRCCGPRHATAKSDRSNDCASSTRRRPAPCARAALARHRALTISLPLALRRVRHAGCHLELLLEVARTPPLSKRLLARRRRELQLDQLVCPSPSCPSGRALQKRAPADSSSGAACQIAVETPLARRPPPRSSALHRMRCARRGPP